MRARSCAKNRNYRGVAINACANVGEGALVNIMKGGMYFKLSEEARVSSFCAERGASVYCIIYVFSVGRAQPGSSSVAYLNKKNSSKVYI